MFLYDVAQWIVHSPLVLEVPGSIPVAERKISVPEHAFPIVICRDDTGLVGRPLDPDVNWMSPVQGKSPRVQVKEPYGNFAVRRITENHSFTENHRKPLGKSYL